MVRGRIHLFEKGGGLNFQYNYDGLRTGGLHGAKPHNIFQELAIRNQEWVF